MTFDWSQFFSALKPSGWHFLAIAVAAAFLAFAPDQALKPIGLDVFRATYRQWIGLSLVLGSALALFSAVKWGADERARGQKKQGEERDRLAAEDRKSEQRLEQLEGFLRNLGDDEWDVINDFLDNNRGGIAFGAEHSAALSLHAKGILGRPEQTVRPFSMIHYSLNPWVPEMLRRKPELRRRRGSR